MVQTKRFFFWSEQKGPFLCFISSLFGNWISELYDDQMRLELEKQNTTQDPYCKGHTASSRKLQRVDWLSVISVTDSAWSFWMQSKLHPPGDPLQDKTNTRNHLPQLSVPGLDESESESDSWVILTTELFSAFFSSRMFFSTFYLALVFTKSSVQLHCQGSEKLLSSFFSYIVFSFLLSVALFTSTHLFTICNL